MKAVGLLLTFSAMLAANPVYSVINLGGMGGSESTGYRINDSGSVIGWAQTPTGTEQSFVTSKGGGVQNVSPSSSDAYAFGINNSGLIVGTSYQNGEAHGWIWSGSGSTDMGAGTFGTGINDSGVVVGGNGHAFVFANGGYQDLGTLAGGDWSAAYGVNEAGIVVGNGSTAWGGFRGFIWSAGSGMMQLGTLGGANSYATDINENGEVVGHSATASGYEHAFMTTGGKLTDLGTLDGGSSYAYGINDSGGIVGYSWSDSEENPCAFLFVNGVMLDLNALVGYGSGWELQQAYGINNAGQIVGTGMFDGKLSAFLLDPVHTSYVDAAAVPEPSTTLLIVLGAAGMLFAIARRRNWHS